MTTSLPSALCTLTFTAFVMTPNSLITSSGLWPEKMCTSAFQSIVRVWLLFVPPWLPPPASARLSLSALLSMRVSQPSDCLSPLQSSKPVWQPPTHEPLQIRMPT